MDRTICINGNYLPESEAKVSVFDRAFLFGDSIYEVVLVIDGRIVDFDNHFARLLRSLNALNMPFSYSESDILDMHFQLVRKNKLSEGVVYLQVTRGEADRDFVYDRSMRANVVAFTQSKSLINSPSQRFGIAVKLVPDIRWARRDIKTTMLLAQVLAKMDARAEDCQEAWMHEDGKITEGASSTAFIVTNANVLVTRPNSQAILPGCTRKAIAELTAQVDLNFEERAFTIEEALASKEAFLTSASSLVTPVVKIEDRKIADGVPGDVTRMLQKAYLDVARSNSRSE